MADREANTGNNDSVLQELSRILGESYRDGSRTAWVQTRSKLASETIEQYVKYFECVARVNRWNDQDKIDMFEASLVPGSPEFNAIAAMKAGSKTSFSVMISNLKESSKPLRDSMVRSFFRLQRGQGQSLDELANKIIKSVNELYADMPEQSRERLARDRFYAALDERLVVALVNSSNLKTIEEIKALAKAIEINLPSKAKQSSSNPSFSGGNGNKQKRCHNCNRMGHIAADCRLKKNAAKKNNSSELSSNKTSSSSSSSKTASNQTIPKEIASICDESNRIIPRQFLRSKINRKTVYCLIDSGSKVSVFPSSWPVEKFGQSVLHTANGSKMLVKGESIVKMNIDSCVIEHTVLIGNVTKPTLGRDFIKKISATITYDDIMYFTWMGNRRRVNLISEDQIDNVNDHDLTDAEVCALAVEHLTVDDDADNENVCGEFEQSGVVNALINRYMDVFEGIGRTNLVEHSIELKTNKVINVKPYPVPYAYRDEVRRMLVEMEQNNIIVKSHSEFCSPLLVVKKKDGSLRLAIDYRKLNAISKFDAQPTPKVQEILFGLDKAKIFSKLDFKSGYYQVPLRRSDQEKTAFRFENTLYHFLVMPFGLSTAAQTFSRLGNILFQLPFVKIYIDDVIVFSKDMDEHVNHLKQVFEILKSANLTLNRKKCEFAKQRIEYLGFVIQGGSIQPSSDKTKCIHEFPVPKCRKDLRSFLGLVNSYRSLVPNYAEKSFDLYELLKQKNRFQWKNNHQRMFENLKVLMSSQPVVRIADLNREFIVRTDASDKAMAGVLQQVDDNGNRYVVEYFSKKFTDCQSRYATIEKEATALKTAIDKWSTYLKGKSFKLETDHRPLVWIKSMVNRNNKLARMAIELAEYEFEISHVKGKDNCDADALSRIEISAIQFDELSSEQESDQLLLLARNKDPNSFIQINHLWYFRHAGRDRLCIPQSRVKEILQLCHDKMNHIGQHKCLDIVFCRFYWPKWRNDVKQWIRKCACNVKKDNDPRPAKQPMCATDILNLNPFEKVAIDIMTLSTSESGNRYLFTLQDYRSKWIEAKASVDSSTERIIDWLEEVWNRFGKPKILISDRGSQFESREFIDYCARTGIEHHRTTPYHHQSNGMVERVHRTIWNLLRVVVADSHNDWDVHLPSVLGVYRNTVHAALGISPFEALFNRPPVIEVDNMFPTRVQPRVADNLKISKYIERMKGNYDERKKVNDQPIAIGTKVLVKHPTIQNRHCQKLLPVNKGPFVVAEQLSPNTYQVKDGDGELLNVHRDQIAPTEIEGVLSKIRKRGRPRKGV